LCAKILDFEIIEFNASDTRSKKSLQNLVREATISGSILGMFKKGKQSKKVLIMDEVDGMSSGDRGGSTELLDIIKNSGIPIICICNDRSAPKMKSLANHCLDLKFRRYYLLIRPTAQQLEKRMGVIAVKEGLNLGANAIGELNQSTSGDIRQILNILSTFRLSERNLTFDASKKMAQQAPKHIIMSPFDIAGKLFSQQNFRSTTMADKIDYYFQDYSLIPLMVQENYINMQPAISRETGLVGKKLAQHVIMMMANAAESVSMGDLLDTAQRNENQWGLLPIHAVISTIRPCFFTHGTMQGMIRFPSWLGQNSKQTKTKRILRELQTKMRLKVSCDKTQFGLEYLPVLSKRLTLPLVKGVEEIQGVIDLMDEYFLNREDWDGIIDLGYSNLLQGIETKTKSAFTRIYNKGVHPSPFTTSSSVGTKKTKAVVDVPDCDDLIVGEDDEEEEEEEDVGKDVKKVEKKVPKKRKSVGEASGSKGKAKKQK
jgi:replication factor C subunit 1